MSNDVAGRNASRRLTSQQLHTNQIGTTDYYPMMYIIFGETSSHEYGKTVAVFIETQHQNFEHKIIQNFRLKHIAIET